jgi:hypothetical protein
VILAVPEDRLVHHKRIEPARFSNTKANPANTGGTHILEHPPIETNPVSQRISSNAPMTQDTAVTIQQFHFNWPYGINIQFLSAEAEPSGRARACIHRNESIQPQPAPENTAPAKPAIGWMILAKGRR